MDEKIISKEDVKYIGGLSRIHLDESEIEFLTKNLEDILHYIKKLEKLDVSKVEPMSHVLPIKNVFRQDKIEPSLTQENALKKERKLTD